VTPLLLSHFSLATALGAGRDQTVAALRAGRSGLRPCAFETAEIATRIGMVEGLDRPITGALADYDCRNNRLALLALEQDGFGQAVADARRRYGAHRIGVFAGTSTSGILETEQLFRECDPATGALPRGFHYRETHNSYSVADFVQHALGLSGPALVVSAACASTAKAFGNAARMMALGLCDAAIVGGADSLCLTTLYGFHSLQLTAEGPCRPFDATRSGISIGEAAGFALVERADPAAGDIQLLGIGESSDAYHMSSPHPEGRYRLYQPARHRDPGRRRGRRPGDLGPVRRPYRLQLDQGPDRPYPGCGRYRRGDHCGAEPGARLHSAQPDDRDARSDPEEPLSRARRGPAAAADHEQFLRLRRQQLQPDPGTRVMKLHVEGIGLLGPGLPDWATGAPILAGRTRHEAAPVTLMPSVLLPPAERRRMTDTVKLALAIGSEAVAQAGREAEDLPSVFTSSGGDGVTITSILAILASAQRDVSPTRFHNSVHNAPSGYWSIATQSRESSTSLCVFDYSFGAGLMEAASLAVTDGRPVLLVSYDMPYPATLNAVRPIGSIFGTALVLAPEPSARSLAALTLSFGPSDAVEATLPAPALEALRANNPSARALPLLIAIAEGAQREVTIRMMAGNLLTIGVAAP